jgi:hypothetical protein
LPACGAAIGERCKRCSHGAVSLTRRGARREYAQISGCLTS